MKNNTFLLALIIFCALILRLVPIGFPVFTSDEARVAFRGYLLSKSGRDELGRTFPLIFNSTSDYQLPVVSYIAALGEAVFGKSDSGARSPFILIGVALVFLTYKIAKIFSREKQFWLLSAFLVAFSPTLIFLSKIPNEFIILTFLVVCLFYCLTRKSISVGLVIFIVMLSFLVSKIAWFIIVPLVIFTLIFFQKNIPIIVKIYISLFCLAIIFATTIIFLRIPQGGRSLIENNFTFFQDAGIKNGIERLRTQGMEAGWPSFAEKILFSKTHFFMVGFFHWLSSLQPSIFFSQFNRSGELGFSSWGAWPKVTILPFLLGVFFLIKKGDPKKRLLILFILIMTVQTLFVYPSNGKGITAITLPFVSLIIAFGLIEASRKLTTIVVSLVILEVVINLFYLFPEEKNLNIIRPSWIKAVVVDGYNSSKYNKVAFSDNITDDIVSYLEWYSPISYADKTFDIRFPYKFRQSELLNFKIIGSDDVFYNCGYDEPTEIFASKRDVAKIQKWLNLKIDKTNIVNTYKDSLGEEKVYRLPPTICVH